MQTVASLFSDLIVVLLLGRVGSQNEKEEKVINLKVLMALMTPSRPEVGQY